MPLQTSGITTVLYMDVTASPVDMGKISVLVWLHISGAFAMSGIMTKNYLYRKVM